jgi:multimeric flavodoxin WrbA
VELILRRWIKAGNNATNDFISEHIILYWEVMMKVLAFNGSPRMGNGNTALILNPFLEGIGEAGAEVELFYTRKLKIEPCTGEHFCWDKTPGQCRIFDDMQFLYSILRSTNILVLATPVYAPLPCKMQNLINRLIPLMNPIIEIRADRSRAKFRQDVKISKIVLVSSCGWWEKGNFGTVLRIVDELAEDISVEFTGALLRPHAYYMREDNKKTRNILKAAKQAGYQLVKKGKMSSEILKIVGSELMSLEEYLKINKQLY